MCRRAVLEALSMVLILSLGLMQTIQACPHPCACYLPTEVHCTFRSLASVPAGIPKHAERINLGFNSIHSLTESSFAGLKKLELLMIHGNDIPKIPNHALKDLTSLQVLKMSYNKLRVITEQTFQGLSSLMRLHVDHNKITFIHPEAFIGLTSLRLLHLEGNLLQQLHPNTFVTFSLFNFFKTSTIKHLYVSENSITTLSPKLFQSMPLLENIYLHGNPWSCDCSLKWLLDWNRNTGGVLKCKKDRTYEGGQLCPKCSTPRQLAKLDVLQVNDMSCFKPVIHSPLKQSGTESWENSGSDHISLEDYQAPFGTIRLNMTDEHGNKVDLQCQIQRPGDSTKFQWSQTNPQEIAYNITLSLDFICPMERANYEKLWKLIAYYSEVPLKLQRGIMLSKHPILSYRYKQGVDHDSYYYTGVKAHVFTEPSWLMQSLINIQLNRRQASTKHVMLSFFTQFSETIEHEVAQRHRSSWVMIENNEGTKTAQSVIAGTLCQLTCTVHGSDTPSIQWVFPDGTLVNAPYHSRDNRISVSSDGKMVIKAVTHSDSGLYYCIAQVHDDTDTMLFIISVQDAAIQSSNNEENIITKYTGESLSLPCSAIGIPDAQLSWILPNNNVLNGLTNTTRVYVLKNGTLFIKDSQVSDSGYYRCVAVNQQGADSFSVKITVAKKAHSHPSKKLKGSKHPSSNIVTKIKEQILEDEEGSGKEKNQDLQEVVSQSTSLRASTNNKNMIESGRTQARLNKKLRKKFKFRKNMQKAEGSSTAEGRRKFSSRKRINVTNRQIDPQHWAKILAKVRGNSVSKTTVSPALNFPSSPSVRSKNKIAPPAAIPPVKADSASTNTAEGSSTDDILSPEEGLLYITTTSNIVKDDNLPATKPFENEKIMINRVPETGDSNQNVFTDVAITLGHDVKSLTAPVAEKYSKFRNTSVLMPTVQSTIPVTIASPVASNTTTTSPFPLNHGKITVVTTTTTLSSLSHLTVSPQKESINTVLKASDKAPVHQSILDDTITSKPIVYQETNPVTVTLNEQTNTIENFVLLAQPTVAVPFRTLTTSPIITSKSNVYSSVNAHTDSPVEGIASNQVWTPRTHIRPSNSQKNISEENKKITDLNHTGVHKHSDHEQFKETHAGRTNNNFILNPKFSQHPGRVNIFNQSTLLVLPKYVPARGTIRPPVPPMRIWPHYFVTNKALPFTNKPEITAFAAKTVQGRKVDTPILTTTTTAAVPPVLRVNPHRFSNRIQSRPNVNSRTFGSNYFPDRRGTTIKLPGINQRHPYYPNSRTPFIFNHPSQSARLANASMAQASAQPSVLSIGKTKTFTSTTTKSLTPVVTTVARTTPSTTLLTTAIDQRQAIASKPSSTTHLNVSRSILYNQKFSHLPFVPEVALPFQNATTVVRPSTDFRSFRERPKITTDSLHTVTVQAGMDAVFPCDTTGEPTPFLTWTKVSTGAVVVANTKIQRFEVLKNGTFIIRNVKLQDRGQYLCTAQNQYGIDKMVVTLAVLAQQPRMLVARYKDATIYLGETVIMECTAEGMPPPQISWILPDRTILRTVFTTQERLMLLQNGTLRIKEANFPDRGIYKCIASNAAGADTLTVRLHVAALPPIIQQLKRETLSVVLGQSIHIDCTAKAAPLPNIRWVLYDGTQIRPSQFINGNLFVFPNGTLYIRNITPRDGGNYECVATNVVGAARRTVSLTLKKLTSNAKITGSSPQKTDVTYGSTLSLDCTASGDPGPRIIWRLPSKKLVDSYYSFDHRIKVNSNGTLVVQSVTDKDAGDYLCVARNKMGDDFVILKVNVMMKPAKIEYKQELSHKVMHGSDLKVDCIATGLPNPEISWALPDGTMINSVMQSDDSGVRTRRFVVFNNGTLYFNDVGTKEEGDYTCYAVNKIGKDEMRVHVKVVAESPVIKDKSYSVTPVPYGDAVTILCAAKGEPTPRITWLSPTNRVIPALSDKYQVHSDGTLFIQKAQRSDNGNYTCIAQNTAGEDKKIVKIEVNVEPPKINGHLNSITAVKEIATKDTRKLIHCKAEGIPFPRVMWVLPENVVLPAPYYGSRITIHRNGTLDIKAFRKKDTVQLVCIARNEGGEARLIVLLSVVEDLRKPTFQNPLSEKFAISIGDTVSLNCSAEGRPLPEIVWVLPNGTQLLSGKHLSKIYHGRDGTLHITNPSAAEAGIYRCTARNEAGYVERTISLDVGQRPTIKNHYTALVSIINGENLRLHCVTQGNPRPHISWTLPTGMVLNHPQTLGHYSLMQNGSLTVLEASVYDRGSYTCKAVNEYGTSILTVPVIVIAYPPRITNGPTPVTYTRLGNTVHLNCMAIGIPKPEVTWELPDKIRLTTATQARVYGNKYLHPQGSLILQKPSQRDTGFYQCTAKNLLGSDSKTTYVHVF
ncbi:matrix-remodeling-associated protein 5 [Latimeria chalumnae]|uniref:matrix-remodeling-associated protein 5 n=1 Tax=Latimeria chalumnae TaxID=7897 RepID=UPI00313D5420